MYCKSSLCKTMQRRKRLGLISAFGLMLFLWKTSPYTCTGHLTLHCRVRDTVASLWRAEGEGPRKPCNCEVCISQQNVSSWFDERYNSTIEPLLTAENQDIPVQVQHWWLKLQGSNNGSYLPDILSKMFKVIPPVSHSWARGNAARCQTCAVVGNSGNLKGSKHGQRIDSHNFVLRMNGAKTAGFEEDVGSRTTHHFMYPESAVNLQPGIHLVLIPFKLLDLKWMTSALSTGDLRFTYMKVKSFIQADKDKVLIFNPSFFKYIHDKWTSHHGKYPSTGILALFFAIHVCDKVSVFGYGADSFGSWHHYWEKNRFASAFRKTGVHNADFELALIKRLAQEGKVTFYT
ncbi:CMP-N-acetylneuraminate-beta-galactosamide-alpha-2,3-sialyltransferase 2-like isoform X1 [Rhinatrema bivittatum]|uniref:CMP-N-acetylneuraminate-beta-galactosamide- alpha-2,3-sialyltransferase 2-like isoform X1 n=1 Tax=Rhinatrema bivittatum TaxID=194408 RepID=UPI00112A87FC|nr:CMP-N-acetylneuraminate-beta-galactosamide-alpha-2,3-sialyltransferase 2-like isoform X1 [Rhinatrema bivittatum]XP_029468760.1 CMP-N-acetylneuraminate-beta-galactosamide-alpha-2,3-sialyltransferase 2-like isoform X1 [Rhinatrema bivittatum]XP_029468761.1 CMP-N-acetylneuraminate-beta-galactosamide-alpha-2,3-sialyltransferase 2-like isoform X1 [Rhinatrema bivittatum]